jgi:hypothetical protein
LNQAEVRQLAIPGNELGIESTAGPGDQSVEWIANATQGGELVELSQIQGEEAQARCIFHRRLQLSESDLDPAQLAEQDDLGDNGCGYPGLTPPRFHGLQGLARAST